MKRAVRVSSIPVVVVVLAVITLGMPGRAWGQDPCPSASGPDAEAGWTAFQGGDMVGARARFEAALARCDNDEYARTGLGYVELREGSTAAAEALFAVVERAEPGNVDALVGLGLVRWRQGELDGVREYFGRVLEYAPDHPTAVEYLERLDGGGVRPQDDADEAWNAGDSERARSLYAARLDEDPSDGLALLRLGLMYGWEGEYGRGLDLLDRLIAADPGHLEARLAHARLLAWSGDLGAATDAVEQILSLEPDNADALATLALLHSWAGRADEALESYDELLAIAPEHSAARRERARALAWAERYEQSLEAYASLAREDPDDVEARLGLARARAYSADFDGALAEYDRVLELDPEEVRALTGRARTLGWSGQLVEAERMARDAVTRHRQSGEAWGALGEVNRWEGRPGAAKEALERATALAPNDAGIRDQLRSVDLSLAPRVRPVVRGEDDSDGNRMVTTSLLGRFHPLPRLEVRAEAYYRDLRQDLSIGPIERTARGGFVTAMYELDPGWRLTGGFGGSTTDGLGDPSFFSYRVAVRSPTRRAVDVSVEVSSVGLDETAALAERGVRSDRMLLTGRWRPTLDWRIDGQVGLGRYEGTETNGRRSLLVTATRGVGEALSFGAGFRAFSFEKNLFDGYFDPDFYGIAEATATWLHQPLPWSFLVEVAPGVEQVTTDGDPTAAFRGNARAAYRISGASEVSLGVSYSTASVTTFASGGEGYEYLSLLLGVSWVF